MKYTSKIEQRRRLKPTPVLKPSFIVRGVFPYDYWDGNLTLKVRVSNCRFSILKNKVLKIVPCISLFFSLEQMVGKIGKQRLWMCNLNQVAQGQVLKKHKNQKFKVYVYKAYLLLTAKYLFENFMAVVILNNTFDTEGFFLHRSTIKVPKKTF